MRVVDWLVPLAAVAARQRHEGSRGGPPGQPTRAPGELDPPEGRLPGGGPGVDCGVCVRRTRWHGLTAGVAVVLVSAGTVFSHRTRTRPPGWVKVVVAAGAIGAFAWFFHSLTSARRHHHHRQPSGPASDLGPRRPLVPCAVPARPALLACRVGGADGGGGGPSHRPCLRSLRRGLGLLRTLGPDRDVDVVERRWTDLRRRTGERAGGHVRRGRGRLRGPSRPGRCVEGVLPDPGRRRRLGRRPGGAGRRFRVAGSAVPCRQPEQPDPRRRLPGLRRQPQHRPAWEPGHHARDAGAGPASLVLGRGDLRHLERPELDRSASGLASTSRVLTVRPPGPGREPTPSAKATCRPSTSRTPPRTSCSTRRVPTSCGSPPPGSSTPMTAPSSRRSVWGPGPSTRSSHR